VKELENMNIAFAKRFVAGAVVVCTVGLMPMRALGWGTEGHRIVARIAARYLDPATRDRLVELIQYDLKANQGYYFLQQREKSNAYEAKCIDLLKLAEKASLTESERDRIVSEGLGCMASWPDPPVKSQRIYTSNWHFVDIPIVMQKATGDVAAHFQFDASISPRYKYSAARDCVTDPRNGDCAIQALERLEPIVGNAISKSNEFGESMEARVEALKFVVHIIGDIHQPLHCVTDKKSIDTVNDPKDHGDLGGNTKIATWFGEAKTPYGLMNLHSIWDDGFISHTMQTMKLTEDDYIAQLVKEKVSDIARKQAGSIFDWAGQSYELAVVDAYGKLPPIDMNYEYQDRSGKTQKGGYRLGDEYYKANNDVVEEQLRLGGVRLAHVLNEIFSKVQK